MKALTTAAFLLFATAASAQGFPYKLYKDGQHYKGIACVSPVHCWLIAQFEDKAHRDAAFDIAIYEDLKVRGWNVKPNPKETQ